jgi:hypothetical protein
MKTLVSRKALPGELNYSFADRWTAVHFAAGMGLGKLGVSPLGMLGLAVAWEIVEPTLKRKMPKMFFPATQDTLANQVGDVTAGVVGNLLFHKLFRQGKR